MHERTLLRHTSRLMSLALLTHMIGPPSCSTITSNAVCVARIDCGICVYNNGSANTTTCMSGSSTGPSDPKAGCCDDWAHLNAQGLRDTTSFKKCSAAKGCLGHCADQISACQADTNCAPALTGCLSACPNTSCIIGCLNSLGSGTPSRNLLTQVYDCMDPCNRKKTCQASTSAAQCTSGSQNTADASCAWKQQCYPKIDPCASLSSSDSCALSTVCAWDTVQQECVAASDQCAAGTDSTSCTSISSNCAWQEACAPIDKCRDKCASQYAACLQSTACTNALVCSSNSTVTDCGALLTGDDVDAFSAVASCTQSECSLQSQCNAPTCDALAQTCNATSHLCGKAIQCAKDAAKDNGDCDTKCIQNCLSDVGMTASSLITSYNQTIQCYRNACIVNNTRLVQSQRDAQSSCADLCQGHRDRCSQDGGCNTGLNCVARAVNKTGSCDSACMSACTKNLAQSSVLLLQNTTNCVHQLCVVGNHTECVPSGCVSASATCLAYASCNASVACAMSVYSATGTCDHKCLQSCAGTPTDGAPADAFDNVVKCYLKSSECGDQTTVANAQCGSSCYNAFLECASDPSCLAGMTCANSTANSLETCFNMTAPKSDARNALTKALLCRQSCHSSSECGSNPTQSSCNGTCSWKSSCASITDPCNANADQTSCAAPCTWDSFHSVCYTVNDPCASNSQAACNGLCQWNQACKASDCTSTCLPLVQACSVLPNCFTAYNCMEAKNKTFNQCVPADNTTADFAAFNALFSCYGSCKGIGKNGQKRTELPDPLAPPPTPFNASTSTLAGCTVCSTQLNACKSNANCKKALTCAGHIYQKDHSCQDDCVASCSNQTSLTASESALLSSFSSCYSQNCSSCDKDCQQFVSLCQADSLCNVGLQCIVANSSVDGRCTGACLSGCFSLVPLSSSRDLLSSLAMCYYDCGAHQDCVVNTSPNTCTANFGDKAKEFASCSWNAVCVPQVDSCQQYTSTSACVAVNNCGWNGVSCSQTSSPCSAHVDQSSCAADIAIGCRWSQSCNANRPCADQCNNQTLACLQYDGCLSAWQCLQSASRQDAKHAQRCAAQIANDSLSLAAFGAFASCYVSCSGGSVCDNQCAAQRQNCSASTGCISFATCNANCQTSACTYNCLTAQTSAGTPDRRLAIELTQCYRQCGSLGKCALTDQEDCNYQTGCFWSSRCVAASSQSCRQFQTSTTCLAANANVTLCSWDTISSRCVGDASQCYAASVLTPSSFTSGDPSLAITPNNTGCQAPCRADGVCLPQDRCDRACYLARVACLQDDVCAPVLGCIETCPDRNSSCVKTCIGSTVSTPLNNLLSCRGKCKIATCGASCVAAQTACVANNNCNTAFQCYLTRIAYQQCDEGCFTDCLKINGDSVAQDLLFNASVCFFKNCDPHFTRHASCRAVSAFPAPVAFQQALCTSSYSQCLAANTVNGNAAVPCAWNMTTSLCDCDLASQPAAVQNEYCALSADNCLQCCYKEVKACRQAGNTLEVCTANSAFLNCTSGCASLLSSANSTKGQALLTYLLSFNTSSSTSPSDPNILAQSIADSFNNANITALDVILMDINQTTLSTSRRRSGTVNVNVNYVVSVDSSGVENVVAAYSSAAVAASLTSAGVTTSSVSSTTISALVATTPAPTSTAATTYYVVYSPLITLPAGAYMTADQQNLAIASYIAAYALSFSTNVIITIKNQLVSAQYQVLGQPSAAALSSQVVAIEYTLSSGAVVTTTSLAAQSSTSSGTSSGTSTTVIAAAVGGGVGGALVVLVAFILIKRRSRQAQEPRSKHSVSSASSIVI